MKDLVSYCKRKGFVFPSSDIYGGLNGFFDYGPLGVELRKNIKDSWWESMVHLRDDIVGLDSSIILHPDVWKASGHVDGFSDPMVDCRSTKARYRADTVLYSKVSVNGDVVGYVSAIDSETSEYEALEAAKDLCKKVGLKSDKIEINLRPITLADDKEYELIPSPASGKPGDLTKPRDFNLMFSTQVGAVESESNVAYLRPETAQGIFIHFRNVVDSTRVKVPFGIAQIGKAFRNEITPRNFIFRSREFEQMEIEYFFRPDEAVWPELHKEWIKTRLEWHSSIGVSSDLLSLHDHAKQDLAHYAKACTDIMFKYPFGVQELEGIAVRGNFDLTQHQSHSGKPMDYFDEATKEKYLPYVIEPSVGVDRTFLALLVSAYDEDEVGGEKRVVLRFKPKIAPVKVAVFPLVKNRPEIVELSKKLYNALKRRWFTIYDEAGAIGRRYRRMDEIGTPWCVTVDFDSLENGTFTLRDRDTTEQIRLNEGELINFFGEKLI